MADQVIKKCLPVYIKILPYKTIHTCMYYTDCNPNDPNLIWGIFVKKFYVGIVTLHSDDLPFDIALIFLNMLVRSSMNMIQRN